MGMFSIEMGVIQPTFGRGWGYIVPIRRLGLSGLGGLTVQIIILAGDGMINYCTWGTEFSDKPMC